MTKRRIDPTVWLQHAWQNRVQSILLLVFMGGFLSLLGWMLWGGSGVLVLLLMGAIIVVINPTFSPRMIMQLYGGRPLTPEQAPSLYSILQELTLRAGVERLPTLYYVPSSMVNSFTLGQRPQSVIAVTDGLLRMLDIREQVGVLAHELSHVRSNDMWVMGLADMFSRMTNMCSLIGQFLLLLNVPLLLLSQVTINWFAILLLILAPNISALAQLRLSRTREYDADLNACRLTGDPEGLARALVKIERSQTHWFERLLMPGRRLPEPSLLRTHPPTEERVRRLLELQTPQATDQNWRRPPETALLKHLNGINVQRSPRRHISGLWH